MTQTLLKTITGIMVVAFISCTSPLNPLKKLEGKWRASGTVDEEHAWFLDYTFKGNTYQMSGYPPISESGTIKLKENKGDSMLVTFKVEKSDPQGYQDHDEWILLKNDNFVMGGNTFRKDPSYTEK